MPDIDFELISPTAIQADDAVLIRRGAAAPNTGALVSATAIANATHTGDVTGSGALTIAADAVTNAKLANVATATIKGRATAGTGDPEDLTGTQATALLDTFTSGAKGLVPASGGGTTNFLRADGTFAAPGGGGSPGGSRCASCCACTGKPSASRDNTTGSVLMQSLHPQPELSPSNEFRCHGNRVATGPAIARTPAH